MAGATFGRKGMADGAAAPQPRAAFGASARASTVSAGQGDPYAAQRAAFLATERTRSGEGTVETYRSGSALEPANRPSFVREKSLFTAYLLWFILGQLSAHRFYLGRTSSGVTQVCLWLVSCLMLIGGFALGIAGLIANLIWIIGDAFLLPGLVRNANERARQSAIGYTFA
jgi:TM2 domain-containing membrane protein YozV